MLYYVYIDGVHVTTVEPSALGLKSKTQVLNWAHRAYAAANVVVLTSRQHRARVAALAVAQARRGSK